LFVVVISLITSIVWAEQVSAQTLVNQGATITITGGATFFVSGHTEIHAGRIDALDLSRVTFDGNVHILTGGLYFFRDARGRISGDMRIDLQGTCWRYKPGVLTVEGTIYNDGQLNNDGEINIGKP